MVGISEWLASGTSRPGLLLQRVLMIITLLLMKIFNDILTKSIAKSVSQS